MEFLVSIFEPVKSLGEAAGKWMGYINKLDANMKILKRKINDLSSQEDDLNNALRCAEQQPRKRRKKEVEDWLRDVQTLKAEVETFQTQEQAVVGWKNVFSRGQLGKLVVEKIQDVAELQGKGRFSNDLVIEDSAIGQFIPTTGSFGETTSARNMKEVWDCLMNDEVRRIGVYGMGGVGKTTLMHHIQNRLLKDKTHDVAWVTVSKASNIRNLQRQIAKALKLCLSKYEDEDEDETTRASDLYAMLSRKERFVLILDDLWEAFPLYKVGIPEPTKDNGCKLVLTTRSLEVCRKMECRAVNVELLTEDEALNLFMSKVEEDQTELTPSVKEIATKVSKECAGLPLAIVSIAGSMKGVNDIRQWRNALNELISSTKDDETEVFERLKFSYSRLKDEKLQHCFLYCALYPEDHSIPREKLIKYWIVEGLIVEMKSTEAMFDKGHTILDKLINTCLLEISTDFCGNKCVKMHDLIRDMALKITSTSPRFMVRTGEESVRVPYEDWSEDLERVSFMCNDVVELPSRPPNCLRLTTLLMIGHEARLCNKLILLRIPDPFFRQMPGLKVLDLSFTGIKSLPKSITKLENLHTLLLEGCKELKDVPSLEKLKALKELKLTESQIEEGPQGIEELVNLRNLDISKNFSLHIFPCWKLCGLIQLQELRIWKIVSAKELLSLTQLEVLEAGFHNPQELTNYVRFQQWQSLKTYSLVVGKDFDHRAWHYSFDERKVRFKNLGRIGVDSIVLPRDIEELKISKWSNLISLSDIQSLRDARDLRICGITYCDELESMFSSSSSFSEDYQIPLRTVEELEFENLPNFRVLFDGVVPPHNISFNLKMLQFSYCPRMKNFFPAKLLQNFPNLEELHVCRCENVEEIIAEVETSDAGHLQDDSNTITLRNFKRLTVSGCPRIKNIFPAKLLQNFPNLEELRVLFCENVEEIIAEVETSDAGHRQDDSNTITLRNFKRLDVVDCPRMKNIFPAKLLQNFPNLEGLEVLGCENVEEIIAEVETSDAGHRQDDSNTITLPNFKSLALLSLPRLNSIYKGIMACETLEYITVYNCPMVRRLPLSLAMDGDGEEASASASASAPPALRYISGRREWWESLEWDDPHTKTTLDPLFQLF